MRRTPTVIAAVAAVVGIPLAAAIAAPTAGPTISSANLTGGTGTKVVNGTIFAKAGQQLTLEVQATNTACVVLANNAKDSSAPFIFTLTAPAGNGTIDVSPTPYGNFNSNNGNCTSAGTAVSRSYKVDNAAPVVTAALTPAPNAAGWNKANVGIAWSADDGTGSGIESGPTPASDSVTGNTDAVAKTSSATDRLGFTGNGSVTVKLDKAAPTITASRSPAANAAGWNTGSVNVGFTCADGLSGIKSCTGATTVSADGRHTIGGTARDTADNTAEASQVVRIDSTPPTLTGAPATSPGASGWYSGPVTIRWTCSDALSDVAGSCPADSRIEGEGENLTASASVSDQAGNTRNATSTPVKLDTSAPLTSASAPSGWSPAGVDVTLRAHDGLSGVAATYYAIDGGEEQRYDGNGVSFATEGTSVLEFWSVDAAGNAEERRSVPVRIDRSAPTIRHSLAPAPNSAGWNNADVTVRFDCSDETSGVASCTDSSVVAAEGLHSVAGTAVDNAGNRAGSVAQVSLDRTAPGIDAGRDREPNDAGWYDADVTVSFSCTDALSGVASCPAAQRLGEGAGQSAQGTATDVAGNEASAGIPGIDVDKTPPEISGEATGTQRNGWYRDDVRVAWTCRDLLSGLAGECPASSVIGDGAEGDDLSAAASVRDRAGNRGQASVTGVRIDRSAPVTQASVPAPVAAGWHAGPVLVTLEGRDALSGVEATHYAIDGDTEERSYSEAFRFDSNGRHTIEFWSRDRAGNVEDRTAAGHTVEVNVDTRNPTIEASRTAANDNGWNNGPVDVRFACADEDSGIAACGPSPVTLSDEGAGQSVRGEARDQVGLTASTRVSDVNIDTTAPSIEGRPDRNANDDGWYNDDVVVGWRCTETLSGLDAAGCPTAARLTGEGGNLSAGPVSATDLAGNRGEGALTGIRIDRTAPAVTIESPAGGASTTADSVTVVAGASDALSGVARVSVNDGAADADAENTAFSRSVALRCGDNEVTAVATDRAGNTSATARRTITRRCMAASKVLAPIATSNGSQGSPTASNLNAFRIKSVVPVKFKVFLDQARTQLMTSPPAGSYAQIAVTRYHTATGSEDATDYVSAGSANTDGRFRWSGSPDHQYIYNLGTSARTPGTYGVQLTLRAADGSALAQSDRQYLVLR